MTRYREEGARSTLKPFFHRTVGINERLLGAHLRGQQRPAASAWYEVQHPGMGERSDGNKDTGLLRAHTSVSEVTTPHPFVLATPWPPPVAVGRLISATLCRLACRQCRRCQPGSLDNLGLPYALDPERRGCGVSRKAVPWGAASIRVVAATMGGIDVVMLIRYGMLFATMVVNVIRFVQIS